MQTAITDPKGTYEQGTGAKFDYDRFFNSKQNWYQIATNARPETSIVKKVLGQPTTCENVLIHYEKAANGVVNYTNFCYVNGKRSPSLDRSGRLIPQTFELPYFHLKDAKTGKETPFNVAVTDYDNFAIVTDQSQYFWILSRKTSICAKAYTYLIDKLVSKNYNVSRITMDARAVKHCEDAPVATETTSVESEGEKK